jgi:hypothetical protein
MDLSMFYKQLFALAIVFSPSVLLADSSPNSSPDEEHFYFRYAIGSSRLALTEEANAGLDADQSALAVQLGLGYLFANQLVTELDRVGHSELFTFFGEDSYSVSEFRLSLGYRVSLGNFQLIPKLGYSKYEFEAQEGHFLDLPETKRKINGSDLVIAVGLEYEFTKLLGVHLELSRLDAEFGKLDAFTVGFRLGF